MKDPNLVFRFDNDRRLKPVYNFTGTPPEVEPNPNNSTLFIEMTNFVLELQHDSGRKRTAYELSRTHAVPLRQAYLLYLWIQGRDDVTIQQRDDAVDLKLWFRQSIVSSLRPSSPNAIREQYEAILALHHGEYCDVKHTKNQLEPTSAFRACFQGDTRIEDQELVIQYFPLSYDPESCNTEGPLELRWAVETLHHPDLMACIRIDKDPQLEEVFRRVHCNVIIGAM